MYATEAKENEREGEIKVSNFLLTLKTKVRPETKPRKPLAATGNMSRT
jgi:hypothetical protein